MDGFWWEGFRAEMPVVERWAYFDHAGVAPLPGPTRGAIAAWADDVAENGSVNWRRWWKTVDFVRETAATLVGADASEIAVIRNTTEGVTLAAEGFPWQAGDNVIAFASEFPSNLLPWTNLMSRGVEPRVLPVEEERIDLDRVAAACDSRTRMIAVSWVGYATGWRNDLAALCEIAHRRGALLFVDAIQGLGVLPLDVSQTPIDFFATDGHKWLLGPEGAGVLYVRGEHLERLRPLGVGWNSVENAGDFAAAEFPLKRTAARYEGGSYNAAGIAGLAASLELLSRIGIEEVSARLRDVTDAVCQRLERCGATIVSRRDADCWSGIVAFDLPGRNPLAIRQRCRDRGVAVNCRGGHVRVSPHVYTNDTDIERLVEALERV